MTEAADLVKAGTSIRDPVWGSLCSPVSLRGRSGTPAEAFFLVLHRQDAAGAFRSSLDNGISW